jgi:superfamily II DNA or RNA helicase
LTYSKTSYKSLVSLRPYQNEGIRAIFDAWNPRTQNLMNVLFQMPTGTGKTTVFSEIVRKARLKEKKVLIVVHRKELVEQIAERLSHFQVAVGIISGTIQPDVEKEVQVATIQTLSKRDYPQADIVIIDECHHAKAATYKKLWDIYPEARFLGVTATPIRMNGEGFSDLFDTLISSGQLSEFVKAGYLVKVRHIVGITPDLSSLKIRMNDYAQNELGELMQNENLMADLVESYQKKANGKKIIIFAVNIEHSKQIVENYRGAGIKAEHIDANTPEKEREHILQLFKEGRIKVLSNVDIVSEGFDVPDCEAVQLARPTKSLGLYLQQVGRCMRPAENKSEGIVLDNAGLWLEHGFCQQDRVWALEGKKMQKRRRDNEIVVAAINHDDIIRKVHIPEEMKGMELIELTKEVKELFLFESYLSIALSNGHKPVSAYYRFTEHMENTNNSLTTIHLQYIQKRLSKLPNAPKEGMWYHEKKGRNLI